MKSVQDAFEGALVLLWVNGAVDEAREGVRVERNLVCLDELGAQ